MSNEISDAVQWFDELSEHLQTKGRLHWQTLKSAVLAQQTNNRQSKPCQTTCCVENYDRQCVHVKYPCRTHS